MSEDINKMQEPTWIKNEHGIKSCWPAFLAKQMVEGHHGWAFAEADVVAEQKQYPVGMGELTSMGLNRRLAAQESVKESKARAADEGEAQELTLVALRAKAKEIGVEKYWVKSAARLRKEIEEDARIAALKE